MTTESESLPVDILESLPDIPAKRNPRKQINQYLEELKLTIVVLDDDPTGTQTVYNIPVLTEWSKDILEQELKTHPRLFYILTNSRSMELKDAEQINFEIGRNLSEVSSQLQRNILIISRSDSTLRGHYPGEVSALGKGLSMETSTQVITPFFEEGGRLTLNDIHYVQEGDRLIPAAATPFARDASFGFKHSNLRKWVEEKSGGSIPAESVRSVSINQLRAPDGMVEIGKTLKKIPEGSVIILNSTLMHDQQTAAAAFLDSIRKGKKYLFRTGASFVRAISGLKKKPLLTEKELSAKEGKGGLIIVGSYVPKTTEQLNILLKSPGIRKLEIHIETFFNEEEADIYISGVIRTIEQTLMEDRSIVVYTGRRLITGTSGEESLNICRKVSQGLVAIISGLTQRPRFVVAKGGITSSDIAVRSLQTKRALVQGQILPGIPVWRLGSESRFPGLPYVVFPGNVGSIKALHEAWNRLRAANGTES